MSSTVSSIEKRRLLKGLGAVLGTAAASQLLGEQSLSAAFAFSPNESSYKKAGKLFSQPQMVILRDIVNQIIPTTDTVGAADVDCHGFIDHQLVAVHGDYEKQAALSIVEKLERVSVLKHKQSFSKLTSEQQFQLLSAIEQQQMGFDGTDKSNFKVIKNLTVFGYCTSKEGATQALKFLYVPGGYQGSVPYKQIGRAWSSKAYY